MAFGTIPVTPLRPKRRAAPSPAPVPRPPAPAPSGERLELLLAAENQTLAEDFLCGVYFNLISAAAGSGLSVYTRQFETVSRLAEVKQQLEQAVLALPGRESVRPQGDHPPLEQAVITLSRAGQQQPALELCFTCALPSGGSGGGRDGVIALVNAGQEAQENRRVGELARARAGAGRIVWAISGFEEMFCLSNDRPCPPPEESLRRRLRTRLELPDRKDDLVTYIQMYGGLEYLSRSEAGAVMRSGQSLRDYLPAACHLPVLAAVGLKTRQCPAGSALAQLWPLLWECFRPWSTESAGWLENGREDGQDET